MIIILEGPDGAGKTTLAAKLRDALQQTGMVHMIKHGPYIGVEPEHICKIFFRGMASALTYDDHVIMDRSWLSEPIYAQIYRNAPSRVDIQRRRMLERAALSRGAVVINCRPSFETCAKTFQSRADDEYLDDTKQLRQVYDEYDFLALQTDLPVVTYDYEMDSLADLMAQIEQATIQNEASGGGAFKTNNYLMLCDRGPRTNVRASAVVVPFINFLDNDGPSRMLANALIEEGIPENKLYWINTQAHDGTPTDPSFIKQLKPNKIFALGNNAYTWALNNNIKAIKLPPPLHHMQNYPDQPYRVLGLDNGNHNS